jgi:hypothetical protein
MQERAAFEFQSQLTEEKAIAEVIDGGSQPSETWSVRTTEKKERT